ncbi:MAG: inositol monophosphatase family protein [Phycisphaerales bacterium]
MPNDRLQAAIDLARAAGHSTLTTFRSNLDVTSKADGSPVTIADRNAERLIRERLAARFPDDAILGEEFGRTPGTSGYEWVLDPIDGTISFIRGVPLYGALIAVLHDNRPVAGVIHMPALDETVHAARGHGCWHTVAARDPIRCHASTTARLADALVALTDPTLFNTHRPGAFDALSRACRSIRGWSDCYAHLLVATGRADAAVEPIVSIWDVAPMAVIMEEAGGAFLDWTGQQRLTAGHAISCAAPLATELRTLLSPFAPDSQAAPSVQQRANP